MYYVNKQHTAHRVDLSHLFGKSIILVVGLLIGACVGLYVAAMTMPLPTQQVIYMTGQ